jgi:hypothetical protein
VIITSTPGGFFGQILTHPFFVYSISSADERSITNFSFNIFIVLILTIYVLFNFLSVKNVDIAKFPSNIFVYISYCFGPSLISSAIVLFYLYKNYDFRSNLATKLKSVLSFNQEPNLRSWVTYNAVSGLVRFQSKKYFPVVVCKGWSRRIGSSNLSIVNLTYALFVLRVWM